MNRKQFIILGIAAVVVTVLALLIGQQESGRREATSYARLYPDLESQLNQIRRLVVHQAGEAPVTIERQDDRWVVVEKGGYSADVKRLREALIALAKMDLIEPKTRNPAKYAKLGVQAIDEAEAQSQDIKLFSEDNRQLVHVIVGKNDATGGSYVRKAAEEQSWLGSERVSFPAKAEDWLDKNLIALDNQRLKRVEVESDKGLSYAIFRSDSSQTDFQLEALPEGKRLKSGQIQRIATALANLTLSDVVAQDQAPNNESTWQRSIFKTFDGLVIKAHTHETEGNHYLKLSAHFDPVLAKDQDSSQAKDEANKDTSPERTEANPQQEAERLQSRFNGWTFIIPSYKATVLALKRDELIEDIEKESAESKTDEDQADASTEDTKPDENK